MAVTKRDEGRLGMFEVIVVHSTAAITTGVLLGLSAWRLAVALSAGWVLLTVVLLLRSREARKHPHV